MHFFRDDTDDHEILGVNSHKVVYSIFQVRGCCRDINSRRSIQSLCSCCHSESGWMGEEWKCDLHSCTRSSANSSELFESETCDLLQDDMTRGYFKSYLFEVYFFCNIRSYWQIYPALNVQKSLARKKRLNLSKFLFRRDLSWVLRTCSWGWANRKAYCTRGETKTSSGSTESQFHCVNK